MDRLIILSQDKGTLEDVRKYMYSLLERKLVFKALKKEDITGFAEAHDIIRIALDEIDALSKVEKKTNNINHAE
ncbi:MAG: hypothetical protein KA802_10530 [Saprospiraceae bacterium]|nr:hypothetical protein [Saprospiraceae bacterium]